MTDNKRPEQRPQITEVFPVTISVRKIAIGEKIKILWQLFAGDRKNPNKQELAQTITEITIAPNTKLLSPGPLPEEIRDCIRALRTKYNIPRFTYVDISQLNEVIPNSVNVTPLNKLD